MKKDPPDYQLRFVLHPEQDAYTHFENGAANPFQPDPADFPRVNAWWLAESALLSYWAPDNAKRIFGAAGFDCEFLSSNGTDCYVASRPEFVIVAFRGTQSDQWKDILADIKVVPTPWTEGMVHTGFKEAFDDIRPELDRSLERLTRGRTLWFCGHSLGGALATLAAHHYPRTRGVCSVGCPRVGDSRFARAFNSKLRGKSFRYVNGHDVVTHVPLPIGYQHVDPRRHIASDGPISDGEQPIPHFFGALIGRPSTLLETIDGLSKGTLKSAPKFLLDHMPKAYAIWMWNDYDAGR